MRVLRRFPVSDEFNSDRKTCRYGQNRDFGSSEGDFDRKPVPQESESASIRSARRFPTFPCFHWSRDLLQKKPLLKISKFSFRSSIVQNVFLSEINSSDTGNLLKTRISDLLQLLEGETLPSELLPRLRRHQETGPPAPAILLMSVHHTTAQRIHTTPARTKQMPEKKKPMPNNASTI